MSDFEFLRFEVLAELGWYEQPPSPAYLCPFPSYEFEFWLTDHSRISVFKCYEHKQCVDSMIIVWHTLVKRYK